MVAEPATTTGELTVPPLIDGGIMLTYRCTNTCRHCLYRCSPRQQDEWMSLATAEKTFAALKREPRLQSVHLAGGEAMLNPDLLQQVIALARQAGIDISYLETNAAWCSSEEHAREAFERLARAGLPAVLISASPFHNEFIPFKRTRWCVRAAGEVFGDQNTIVWVASVYQALARLPGDRTRSIEAFLDALDVPGRIHALRTLYPMIPGGRVTEQLRECFEPRPPESFEGQACARELTSTVHFHIDPHGYLFTGHCPGIVAGIVEDLHPRLTSDTHPSFCTLHAAGPVGLMRLACEKFDYQPRPDGYVSKCDLCLRVRSHLRETGQFPDLEPAAFYA